MIFKRTVYNHLINWKNERSRLPLIIRGARQVGKTSLIMSFGEDFPDIHVFNFQKSPDLKNGFIKTNEPQKILQYLEVISSKKIDIEHDLIFFDEIQDCPQALNSLKFFAEELPSAYIIAAGSLLGIHLSEHPFPVGKVKFQHMFPLSFFEFLSAIGKPQLANILLEINSDNNNLHEEFIEHLRLYFALGGMPKVITTYLENYDLNKARELQEDLLISYRADFSKYSGPADAVKILSVFENIPKQLSKDNRKFRFNLLKQGARYPQFASSIDWLINAGICLKLPILNHIEIPLKPLIDDNTFKLYFFDIGLLGALSGLPIASFLRESNLFKTFKGAFVENYFFQEFKANRKEDLYCWQGKASEVDFLYLSNNSELVPIEVKAGESGKLKSLQAFASKYKCDWKTRCSMHKIEIRSDTKLRSIPLHYAGLV